MKIMVKDFRGIQIVKVQVVDANIDMFSSSGKYVNKESVSRLSMHNLGSCWQISSTKWDESVAIY